jgi:hypothetical protein
VTANKLFIHSLLIATVVATFALSACGGDSGGTDTAVASVVVSPGAPPVSVGSSVQLTAVLRNANGQVVTGQTVTWSSANTAILSVTPTGLVTAHQPGSARITASAGGKAGFADPVANQPAPAPVATVVISPASDVMEEGATRQLTASLYDAHENLLTGRGISWTSAETGIAHVDAAGVITGLRPGLTQITAKAEGQTATADIRVEAHYSYELLYRRQTVGGAPDVHTLDFKDPAAVSLPVFQDGTVALQPAASPDGSRIAFVVPTSPGTAIYIANRDGSGIRALISDDRINEQPAWSPDSNFIAFRREASDGGSDIWVMSAADGDNAVNLTGGFHGDGADRRSPAWSPVLADGNSRIAYVHTDEGQLQIWSMQSDGSDHRRVTFSATADDDQPAWSPDGESLVFQRSDSAIFGDLWIVSAAGGNGAALRPAAPLALAQRRPQWSPDGKLIAFASRHEGDFYQIYTVWSDGSWLARRTFEESHHDYPGWLIVE